MILFVSSLLLYLGNSKEGGRDAHHYFVELSPCIFPLIKLINHIKHQCFAARYVQSKIAPTRREQYHTKKRTEKKADGYKVRVRECGVPCMIYYEK